MSTAKEVFEQYDKLNEKGQYTYGSQGDAMSAIQKISLTDPDEALKLANLYVEGAAQDIVVITANDVPVEGEEHSGPVSYERATEVTKINIGYICGYYGPELAKFWYPAINTTHPIFGDNPEAITPANAFASGETLAEAMAAGDDTETAEKKAAAVAQGQKE